MLYIIPSNRFPSKRLCGAPLSQPRLKIRNKLWLSELMHHLDAPTPLELSVALENIVFGDEEGISDDTIRKWLSRGSAPKSKKEEIHKHLKEDVAWWLESVWSIGPFSSPVWNSMSLSHKLVDLPNMDDDRCPPLSKCMLGGLCAAISQFMNLEADILLPANSGIFDRAENLIQQARLELANHLTGEEGDTPFSKLNLTPQELGCVIMDQLEWEIERVEPLETRRTGFTEMMDVERDVLDVIIESNADYNFPVPACDATSVLPVLNLI